MATVRTEDEVLHSRQVAEAAREAEWKGEGFLRELFLGCPRRLARMPIR